MRAADVRSEDAGIVKSTIPPLASSAPPAAKAHVEAFARWRASLRNARPSGVQARSVRQRPGSSDASFFECAFTAHTLPNVTPATPSPASVNPNTLRAVRAPLGVSWVSGARGGGAG